MLFLAGLESSDSEALRSCLALLKKVNLYALTIEHVDKTGRSASGRLHGLVDILARTSITLVDHGELNQRFTCSIARNLSHLGNALNEYATGEAHYLYDAIKLEREMLRDTDDETLRRQILEVLADLADVPHKERDDSRAIARHVLRKCARHYRIDTEMTTVEAVEARVAVAFFEEIMQQLRQQGVEGKLDEEELELLLEDMIGRMAEGDAKTMREALSLDKMSGAVLVDVLRRGGLTVSVLASLSAAGMGPFLALTTLIKSFTLLTGVTASFGTYTAAASGLGYLLSPVGLLVATGAAMTPVALYAKGTLKCALLAGVVASLHAHLHQQGRVKQ